MARSTKSTGSTNTNLRWSVVRTLFELLYRNRTLYWLASTLPFAGQWRVWQRLVLPRIDGRDVLEVGCGIGTLLADMIEAGYTCSAIDRSPQMVAATRDRLRRHRYTTEAASVRQASVQQLPFDDASFDTAVSTFPTEYIYEPAALREIARVLRPGGRLIVVLGATLLPANALVWPLVAVQTLVYGRQQPWRSRGRGERNGARGGPEIYTSDVLAQRLRAAGLMPDIERVRGPFWEATLYIAQKSVLPGGTSSHTLV
ncbi:MAG TPA: class I SAM-dependent methyltransferase [Ktedonobacterales bacterium]